jgi:hypothetical protein
MSCESSFTPARLEARLLAGELHQQDRLRLAAHELAHDGCERRVGERQVEHGAVDELHGARAQLHDVLRGIHRVVEAGEVGDAERLVLGQRCQPDVDALEPRERPPRCPPGGARG